MKSRSFMILFLALLMVPALQGTLSAQSYSIDCQGTLEAWAIDPRLQEYLRTHTCTCPRSDRSPECRPKGTAGPAGTRPAVPMTEDEAKRMMLEGILKNVFTPQNNAAQQEELKRKQQEEAARKQREEDERRRQQEAFERHKQELLNAFKSGNQGTGLRLKGGGEELLDDPQQVSGDGADGRRQP